MWPKCLCPRRDSNSQAASAAGDFESAATGERKGIPLSRVGVSGRAFVHIPSRIATDSATARDRVRRSDLLEGNGQRWRGLSYRLARLASAIAPLAATPPTNRKSLNRSHFARALTPPVTQTGGGIMSLLSGLDLAPAEERALLKLVEGGRITARRTFPCPHRYHIVAVDGTRVELTKSNIASLVAARLLDAKPLDPRCDAIDYRASAEAIRRSGGRT